MTRSRLPLTDSVSTPTLRPIGIHILPFGLPQSMMPSIVNSLA